MQRIRLATMVAAAILPGSMPVAGTAGGKDKDPNRQVCRNVIPTGSRMGTRVCRTAAEWERNTKRIQDDLSRSDQENSIRYDTGEREGMINSPRA